MKRFVILLMLIGLSTASAWAHRLDEYLQATILSLEPGTIHATMRMVPGVAVAEQIIAQIDTNRDGQLSQTEQEAYAKRVLNDLSLREDGSPLTLRLTAFELPSLESMRRGTGEIVLEFAADFSKRGSRHELIFENHHLPNLSVYLVNTLVPGDKHIRIGSQFRNHNQSSYCLYFETAGSTPASGPSLTFSGLNAAIRLGMHHIAEGTDHLLFLLTLLLPAPLAVSAHRWAGRTSARKSLLKILRIVTAFTLGHSLTLTLAGFGLVKVPSQPIEVLIAVSIFVSAIHALRPLFPGREAIIAASFGLIHGLAFASALSELGFTGWYRLISVFGFNLGIETMQLIIVAVTMPSLLLLSRTSFYKPFRVMGALFALVASSAWMIERVSGNPNRIAQDIAQFAQHGAVVFGALFVLSLLAYVMREHCADRMELQAEPQARIDTSHLETS
ncbi:HupE/UreJ family protein [Silvibacterium dinghuense]|uniref:HupE/UreJ family protein n=1 Tax=Silvibacterium dinghuense TaxID=1560006 RepID=A0A4Q1S840_9BACT|nr:HupE/UreJ family protein [Silvibacterium dinghuense]RXS93007.1 HupE/UreJ family protein [Silvibacterium dinghuense]GGG90233.1 hypothetical protein GCM10011586_00810 [Silvibacterium dinghuense]